MEVRPFKKSSCIFTFPWSAETYTILSDMPGFKKWEGRTLIFRPTSANLDYMALHFPLAAWLDGTEALLKAEYGRKKEAQAALEAKTGVIGKDDYKHKTAPYEHQQRAFVASRDLIPYALHMDPGTGKTKVALDTACYLYSKGKIKTVIILAPNGVHRNWVDNEMPTHIPDWCQYSAYFHSPSSPVKFQRRFDRALSEVKGLRLFAFYFDCLGVNRVRTMIDSILMEGECMVIVDESTRIKTPGSLRTKYITQLGESATYRRNLTGTPVTVGVEDLFSQFKFLDKRIIGFDTYTSFTHHFCQIQTFNKGGGDKQEFSKIVGYKNLPELISKIEPYSFRVLKSQCLDLPPKIYKRWPIELSKKQRQIYDDLRKNFIAEMDGDTLTAELAMTRILRLQQIACNWFPMNETKDINGEFKRWSGEPKPIETNPNPRLQALDDILEETKDLPGKKIIWAPFRPDLDMLSNYYRSRAVSYHGGVKENDRALAIKRFQEDPTIDILVANQQSAGIGLTLTAASVVIYYANKFSAELRWQSEDRNHRIGQREECLYYDIEAVRTVDAKIIKTLKLRKDIADLVTGDPRSFFLEDED